MKERSISVDIITALISVLLSFVFIVLALCFVVYNSFLGVIEPAGITDAINGIEYETFVFENPKLEKGLKNFGVNSETAEDFFGSEAFKDVGELYSQDVLSALRGESDTPAKFNLENVQGALICNLDSLVNILVDKDTPEEEALKAESKIVSAIKNNSDVIVKSLPNKTEIAESIVDTGMSEGIYFIFNPSLKGLILIFLAIVAVAIFVLRFYNFGGLLWIGTNCVIISIINIVIAFLTAVGVIDYLILSDIVGNVFANSFMGVLSFRLFFSFAVVLIIGILMFVLFSILKKRFLNKKMVK